jgi:hypothetical protein
MKNFKSLFLIMFVMLTSVSLSSAQVHRGFYLKKYVYTQKDTIIVENTTVTGENGDYLIELPSKDNLIIAYNLSHTNAIVLYAGFPFYKQKEYNVADSPTRLVLWYKDEHLYCGFTYDKRAKICRYFEAINEKDKEKLVKKFPFLKNMRTFN